MKNQHIEVCCCCLFTINSSVFLLAGCCEVFSFIETSIFVFVEFQVSWACNTSNSDSLPASDVLTMVGWISNISAEVWSVFWTGIRAYEGGGWFPFLGGDTFVSFAVQALVTILTEFQAQWPAGLTVSQSTDTLEKVVWLWSNGKVSISFSTAHTIWAINGGWCCSSNWRVGYSCSS